MLGLPTVEGACWRTPPIEVVLKLWSRAAIALYLAVLLKLFDLPAWIEEYSALALVTRTCEGLTELPPYVVDCKLPMSLALK